MYVININVFMYVCMYARMYTYTNSFNGSIVMINY